MATESQRIPTLLAGDLKLVEYANPPLQVTLPPEWDFADALRPEFWSGVAHRFKAGDGQADRRGAIIHVNTEDGRFVADLVVVAVQDRGLIVECIGPAHDKAGKGIPYYLGAEAQEEASRVFGREAQFEIKWNVGARGWSIIRNSDRQVVNQPSQFPRKEDAVAWVRKMTAEVV